MRVSTICLTILSLLTACEKENKQNIVGNWYLDLGDPGRLDSASNYQEFYRSDSMFTSPDDFADQLQKYRVGDDTIFFSDIFEHSEFRPYYKILLRKNDTLFLKYLQNFPLKNDTVYWVKLPDNVKGYFDYASKQIKTDSIVLQLKREFESRMARYYSEKGIKIPYHNK